MRTTPSLCRPARSVFEPTVPQHRAVPLAGPQASGFYLRLAHAESGDDAIIGSTAGVVRPDPASPARRAPQIPHAAAGGCAVRQRPPGPDRARTTRAGRGSATRAGRLEPRHRAARTNAFCDFPLLRLSEQVTVLTVECGDDGPLGREAAAPTCAQRREARQNRPDGVKPGT